MSGSGNGNGNNHEKRPDPVERRLECIGKRIREDTANDEEIIQNIHAIAESCARSLAGVVKGNPEGYDTGRLIAALDTLEHAKQIAIQAIHLAQK